MTSELNAVHKGKQMMPPRIVIYSEHGLGKSTWASQAPEPIFIQTEDGLAAIDTTSFPLAKRYQDVLDALGSLYREDHPYKTVVIDSLDWLEDLIWKHVAETGGYDNIEGFGYGKGYTLAADQFRQLLAGLDALRRKKNMVVVLTAHAHVRRFDDPASESYDRYMLKLHAKAAGLVQEWADVIGFIAQEMIVRKEDVGFNKKVSRGIATGGHVLHLKRTPAYDAKTRFDLPDALPLSWSDFADALSKAQQSEQAPTTK